MARSDLQHNHRFNPGLKELLLREAQANKRSLTAEINARLEQSFTAVAQGGDAPSADPHTVPLLLSVESKVDALCRHLGVKLSDPK